MNPREIIESGRRLEAWVSAYEDVLGQDIAALRSKHNIDRTEDLAKSFAKLDDDNRLLTIGIVGRVKAGKSSLLNALLFDGASVLPKAATPMTAALTTLTFGDKFSADIQYFDASDLDQIETEARQFDRRVKAIEDSIITRLTSQQHRQDNNFDIAKISEQARRQAMRDATRESPSMAASHDQWQRIHSSPKYMMRHALPATLEATSPQDLSNRLLDFVGADGQFMPFTKSVDISLPIEWLRDMRIVDTPGMDDPVQSREQRTRQLLKNCDVVLVVSPAGQFLNEHDLGAMSLIRKHEGIHRIAVVASQVDNQFFGSAQRENPQQTLRAIADDLGHHMVETLSRLKLANPEFGDTFDDLISGGINGLMCTSSVCASLSNRLDQHASWSESDRIVWDNLAHTFPDFFNLDNTRRCRDNLQSLGNVDGVKDLIANARTHKSEIFSSRVNELASAKVRSLQAFKDELRGYMLRRLHELESVNIKVLKRQQSALRTIEANATSEVDGEYEAWKVEFLLDLERKLRDSIERIYRESVSRTDESRTERKESVTHQNEGFFNWLADALWNGGKITVSTSVVTVYRDKAMEAVDYLVNRLNAELRNVAGVALVDSKNRLSSTLTMAARRHIEKAMSMLMEEKDDDGDLESDVAIGWINAAVANVRASIKQPVPKIVAIDREVPKERFLKEEVATEFLKSIRSDVEELHRNAGIEAEQFVAKVRGNIPDSVAAHMFSDIRLRVDKMVEDMNTLALSLDRLKRMQKDLELA